MEQSPQDGTQAHPPIEVKTGDAEVRVDIPINRYELDARFREVKTRIWIVGAAGFLGSILGGSLHPSIAPSSPAGAMLLDLWRFLS